MITDDHDRTLKLYETYRDYLKHEDGLINFRVTWFIATQAAIFAAYGLLAQDVFRTGSFTYGDGPFPLLQAVQPFRPTPWLAVVLLLCLLGGLSSITSFFSINAASRAMKTLSWRWHQIVLQGQENELLPALKGGGSWWAEVFGWLSARFLPAVSLIVWVAIAFAHVYLLPAQTLGAR